MRMTPRADAEVDPRLLPGKEGVAVTVAEPHGLVPVAERLAETWTPCQLSARSFPSQKRSQNPFSAGSEMPVLNAPRAAWNRSSPSVKPTVRLAGGSGELAAGAAGKNNPARGLSAYRAGSKYTVTLPGQVSLSRRDPAVFCCKVRRFTAV